MNENKLSKINSIWQRLTGILAPILTTIMVLIWINGFTNNLFEWLLWLHLPIVMFHEFEEYVFPYPKGFQLFFNKYTPFAKEAPIKNPPINEKKVFIINIGTWFLIILGALLANRAPWFGMGIAIFEIMNIMGHIAGLQIKKPGYNPGLMTAMFLLCPYLTVIIWTGIFNNILTPIEWGIAIAIGVLMALIIIIKGNFSKNKN